MSVTMGAVASALGTWRSRGMSVASGLDRGPHGAGRLDGHVVGTERRASSRRTRAGCRRGPGSRPSARTRPGASPRRCPTRCRRGWRPRCRRTPAASRRSRYSSILSGGTSKATWFIEPMALVSSPWSGRAAGRRDAGRRLGCVGEPEEGQAVAAPAVEEEVLAHAGRQLDRLDQRHAQHVGVEVDRPAHVATHQRQVVDAVELEAWRTHGPNPRSRSAGQGAPASAGRATVVGGVSAATRTGSRVVEKSRASARFLA